MTTIRDQFSALLLPLGKVPPEASEQYSRSFVRILSVIEETYALEAEKPGPRVPPDRLAYVRDLADQFGRTLEAVYRYSLWDALADETIELALGLRSRGFGAPALYRLLSAWTMAILSAVKPPECHSLTRPLETIRKEAHLLFDAADLAAERPQVVSDGPADAFLAAVFNNDLPGAFERLRAHYERSGSVEDVLDRLLFAALEAIGRRWAEDRLSVAGEHAATAALRSVMHRFFDSLPAGAPLARRVAVTCVPGDEHDLGAEILARILSFRGWPVYFIGRSSPEGEIVRAVAEGGFPAVLLSVSMVRHLPALESLARALRDLSRPVTLIAGGAAIRRAGGGAEAVVRGLVDAVARTPAQAHRVLLGTERGHA